MPLRRAAQRIASGRRAAGGARTPFRASPTGAGLRQLLDRATRPPAVGTSTSLRGLSRARSPLLAALLAAAFLASLWQQQNSERTAERPGPPEPEPFDPFDVTEGTETLFGGLQFFRGTRRSLSGSTADGGPTEDVTGEDFAAAGLRWGPTFPVVPVGENSTGGGFTRNLLLLAPNGMVIGTLGFADWSVTSTSPIGLGSITISDRTSWSLEGAGGSIPLPGQAPPPGPAQPRPVTGARRGALPLVGRPGGSPGGAPAVAPSVPGSPVPQLPPAPDPPLLPAAPPRPQVRPPVAQQPTAPANGQQLGTDGRPVPAPRPDPRPTPGGSTFLPGGIELPPNGPRPTPQGMATEMGKLERKLEILLQPDGPPNLLDLFNRVIDQIENIRFVLDALFPPEPYRFDAGAYTMTPVCETDADGNPRPPLEAPWSGGEGEFTELRQRLDALAQLLQHHKDTKQPTCGGRGSGPGSNVTVLFESD